MELLAGVPWDGAPARSPTESASRFECGAVRVSNVHVGARVRVSTMLGALIELTAAQPK
jgi:hypothetical protein